MADISVGQVSGLIAAGVFAVQFFIPLALPILLVAYVAEKNSVVTWSVLGRFLHTSPWPSILRTDTAATHGVQRRVSFTGLFQTGALALVAVASIVTPLGLYDAVTPGATQLEAFQYLRDASPFGYGTPLRSTAPFTRVCGGACPGTSFNETCVRPNVNGGEICSSEEDITVPDVLKTFFKDGATNFGHSVSSVFDIQWRTHLNATGFLRSAYRQISTLILEPSIHVVEGLIVDTQTGGIGFRNHTGPGKALKYGSTWSEDILFIEPETQCVDLNFTFNFHLEQFDNQPRPVVRGLYIKDDGGFSNLARKSPVAMLGNPSSYNGQGNIDLRDRAYSAAWLNNFLTMVYFNLTNPDMTNITRIDVEPGMEIQSNSSLPQSSSSFVIEYQSIRSSRSYGEYLVFNKSLTAGNPFNVSVENFESIGNSCTGTITSDPANLNSSLVGCGLLYGAARRTDGGVSLAPDLGSKWAVPVYSCASSVKAVIRTVTFQYNGTENLTSLHVTSAEAKTYSDPPLWGVEDMHNMSIYEAQPLWGIMGSNTTMGTLKANISSVSHETLRLPGIMEEWTLPSNPNAPIPSKSYQNLPGVDFYTQALRNAFSIARPSPLSYGDYSGQTGFALFAKWQNMSTTAADASGIIDLVWTDVAANSVVGTKGWGLSSVVAGTASDQKSVPVTVYRKKVRYHMAFAVPAFVVLAVALAILVAAIVLLASKKTGPAKLRLLIEATSAGRLIGLYLWPEEPPGLKTDAWVKKIGTKTAVFSSEGFTAADAAVDTAVEEAAPVETLVEAPNKTTPNDGTTNQSHTSSEQDNTSSGQDTARSESEAQNSTTPSSQPPATATLST